jgi:hypothetical protein
MAPITAETIVVISKVPTNATGIGTPVRHDEAEPIGAEAEEHAVSE